mmetsp:Transcript_38674/g.60314  ORF Transcript_38674/g.60314 Transcript_38674/m.60314 type:complete len:85 (-) Transcript_38674:183-437(-)
MLERELQMTQNQFLRCYTDDQDLKLQAQMRQKESSKEVQNQIKRYVPTLERYATPEARKPLLEVLEELGAFLHPSPLNPQVLGD